MHQAVALTQTYADLLQRCGDKAKVAHIATASAPSMPRNTTVGFPSAAIGLHRIGHQRVPIQSQLVVGAAHLNISLRYSVLIYHNTMTAAALSMYIQGDATVHE
jgi:hypothetical protein